MKKTIEILNELKDNNWKIKNKNPFIEKVLFPALEEVVKENEKVLSQIWGVRLNENGTLTSEYELLTLTDKRIISLYSDLSNQNDKIKINSYSIKNVHKLMIQNSTAHENSLRVDIILKNNAWALETDEVETTTHFKENLDKLIETKTEDGTKTEEVKMTEEKVKNFWHFLMGNKRNILFNVNLWLLVSIVFSFGILITSSIFVGTKIPNKNVYIPVGVFQTIFAALVAFSMVMLSLSVWDNERFSINLYRAFMSFTLFLLIFIFGILTASHNVQSKTFESITIVLSVISIVDTSYSFFKNYFIYSIS